MSGYLFISKLVVLQGLSRVRVSNMVLLIITTYIINIKNKLNSYILMLFISRNIYLTFICNFFFKCNIIYYI